MMDTNFVELANDKNASEFETQFNASLSERMELALAAKKTEVAQNFFVTETPETT